MKFKGTKGKWVITDGHPNGKEIDALRIQADSVIRWDICAVWNDLSTEESKANALLISKAPEMLEELIKEVEILKSMGLGDTERCKRKEQLIKEATEL